MIGSALAELVVANHILYDRGVVDVTLRQAVFRAVYAEVNAKLQATAIGLGPVTYLTEAEAAAAATTDGQIDRCWSLWQREAGAPD